MGLALWTALVLSAAASGAGLVWKPGFGLAPLWNDGNAEVSVYEARDVRYGIPRDSRAVLIVVAEDLLRGSLVKPEGAGGGASIRVLKLNHVRSIPTGVYTYQQMLSAFLGADRLDPVKLTVTSHEWCGNTFVEWRSDRAALEIRTYFETPADVDVPLSPADAVFYDALPLKLRALDFERSTQGVLPIVESVFSSRPSPPEVASARVRVSRVASPSPAYRVTLARGERSDTLDFEAAFPHRLRRWERSDGGSMRLTDSRRYKYWEKNAPGDERLLSPPATR